MSEQPSRNAESYSESEVDIEVGRSAGTGEFVPVYVARGWRNRFVVHHFRRLIARGPLGRFVRRRKG